MSDGDQAMDNRRATNARQFAVTSPREVVTAASSKYARQYGGSGRRDFGAGRPIGDANAGRKPTQAKTRFNDKRPRFRGPHGGDTKEEVTKEEPPVPEYGSAQVWGSKKSNLNHLLNFCFESVHDAHSWGRGSRSTPYVAGRYGGYSGRRGGTMPYNKERFLQANCQFVVREGSDYSIHSIDPDVLVDWDCIEEVRIFGHQVPSCPICLYPPKAAKITRCGHMYCWPCILHYLSLDDKTWRKCPICYEAIHAKDLKSVSALETHHYSVGEQITMKLMRKPRGKLRVLPASETTFADDGFPLDVSDVTYACYAKLLSASVSHIQQITSAERQELQQQLCEEGEGTLEGSFISAALASLAERELVLQSLPGSDNSSPVAAAAAAAAAAVETSLKPEPPVVTCAPEPTAQPKHCYVSAFDDEAEDVVRDDETFVSVGMDDDLISTVSMETRSTGMGRGMFEVRSSPAIVAPGGSGSDDRVQWDKADGGGSGGVEGLMEGLSVSCGQPDEEPIAAAASAAAANSGSSGTVTDNAFYFYQAVDGQHVYMHAVNIHCLVEQYGSLSQCPHVVTATVVEMEAVSMDEDLRRRLRYLSHLPLTCEFVMAELDLRPPVVSPRVLARFRDELEKRKLIRQRKARNEKKLATRIQREENRSLGIDPTMRIVRSEFARSLSQPSCLGSSPPAAGVAPVVAVSASSPGQGESAVSRSDAAGVSPVTADVALSTSPTGSCSASPTSSAGVPSFAQMLKAGKARPASDVWPKVSKQGSAAGLANGGASGAERDDDGEDYQQSRRTTENSLSDAIQAALDSYRKEPLGSTGASAVDGSLDSTAGGAVGSGAGKKKNKKKLLFSTGLPRTG